MFSLIERKNKMKALIILMSTLSASSALASAQHFEISQAIQSKNDGAVSVLEAAQIYAGSIQNFSRAMMSTQVSVGSKEQLARLYLDYTIEEIEKQTGGSGRVYQYFMSLHSKLDQMIKDGKMQEAAFFVNQAEANFK